MVALPVRSQHGGEEPAAHREQTECQRVLQDPQQNRERREQHQQRKCGPGRHHREQPERGEYREIENADGAALQSQRVAGSLSAQPPAEAQQHNARGRDTRKPELDGHVRMLRDVSQEKSDSNKENDDAHAHQRVAAGEIFPQRSNDDALGLRFCAAWSGLMALGSRGLRAIRRYACRRH